MLFECSRYLCDELITICFFWLVYFAALTRNSDCFCVPMTLSDLTVIRLSLHCLNFL